MTILKALGVLAVWLLALVVLLISLAAVLGLVVMVFLEVAW